MDKTGNKVKTVGIGDYLLSSDPEDVLVTYGLGTCMGVAVWDPKARVGGILHFMLPDSSLNPAKAAQQPALFGDTGMALFLTELFQLGGQKRNLAVKLAGAAETKGRGEVFNVSHRNLLVAKRFLWKNDLMAEAEETGGEGSRTLRLWIGDGRVTVKDGNGEHEI